MKHRFRDVIFGVIIGALIVTPVLAEGSDKRMIEAVFGEIKLVVDGKTVDKETLLYDGTTYVPLRAAGEALDKLVYYDDSTKTAVLTSKDTSPPEPSLIPTLPPSPEPSKDTTEASSESKPKTWTTKDDPGYITQITYGCSSAIFDNKYYLSGGGSLSSQYSCSIYNASGYKIIDLSIKGFNVNEDKAFAIKCDQVIEPGSYKTVTSLTGNPPVGSIRNFLKSTYVTDFTITAKDQYGKKLTHDFNYETRTYTVTEY